MQGCRRGRRQRLRRSSGRLLWLRCRLLLLRVLRLVLLLCPRQRGCCQRRHRLRRSSVRLLQLRWRLLLLRVLRLVLLRCPRQSGCCHRRRRLRRSSGRLLWLSWQRRQPVLARPSLLLLCLLRLLVLLCLLRWRRPLLLLLLLHSPVWLLLVASAAARAAWLGCRLLCHSLGAAGGPPLVLLALLRASRSPCRCCAGRCHCCRLGPARPRPCDHCCRAPGVCHLTKVPVQRLVHAVQGLRADRRCTGLWAKLRHERTAWLPAACSHTGGLLRVGRQALQEQCAQPCAMLAAAALTQMSPSSNVAVCSSDAGS